MIPNQKILNLQGLNFLQNSSLKVGILGGSFNPSHAGHLSISLQALKFYQFDYIIWLVSNQNPIKSAYIDDIFLRSKKACSIAIHPKIIISTAEHDLNCYYSYDSLNYLVKKFSKINFTWILGMDYIASFHKWHRSKEIQELCDIIFFDRPCPLRLVNLNAIGLNNNAKLAKTKSNNIIIHRRILCDVSSSTIRNTLIK
ncbi:MAG: nicotinic acid mononucleotide adenylyltransferase [Rickettsiales bacterium]|nr:MAG: nicotinic acid mononucleotide adenylyltransferase [Rickettsiales bacterium]